ncbi:MAG: Prolipoprotein diacylglyceryl transferase, partial [Candidatus Anoxychlamydiales bacterium]|nr:Prolipoprotein diacylglyceryl transferase [Candidatus Anoxychlamydiales bacterium]
MLAYIYWNPRKEIFTIPFLNIPIVWYSIFFLLGFAIGYYIFIDILRRYFSLYLEITVKDVISFYSLKHDLIDPKNEDQRKIKQQVFYKQKIESKIKILELLNAYIKRSVKKRYFVEKAFSKAILTTKKKLVLITDRLTIYVIIATVIGARLGHLIFYEEPSYYLKNPLNIIKVWKGGLASHGAGVTILIALIFVWKYIKKYTPKLSYVRILDFMAVPTVLAGFFIRLG